MPNPGLTLETMREAIALVEQHGGITAASVAENIPRQTLDHRYERARAASQRGEFGFEAVMPGFQVSRVTTGKDGKPVSIQQKPGAGEPFTMPKGHVLKGVSSLLDPTGRVTAQWVKTRQGELDPGQLVEILKDAFSTIEAKAPLVATPAKTEKDLLAVYPLVDWHVGLLAWARETGEDYDLKIARSAIMGKMRQLISATPAADEALILGIGDLLHFDGYVPETPSSKHPLDSDGRYPKVLETAVDMVEETIELALQRHRRTSVKILPGNHDPVSAVAVALTLARIFRGNKRVTVDTGHGYQFWFRRGKVFLGASHGDKSRMTDLPLLMAADRPEDWAESKGGYRKVFTGHIHHESKIEEGGVIVESMRSPVAKDAYHSFQRYRAGRSVYSETFRLDGSEAATLTFNL